MARSAGRCDAGGSLAAVTAAAAGAPEIGTAATLDAVARAAVRAPELLAVQVLARDVVDADLRLVASAGFGRTTQDGVEDRIRECERRGAVLPAWEVLRTGRPVRRERWRDEVLGEPMWAPVRDTMLAWPWDTWVGLPITLDGNPVGVLAAFYRLGTGATPGSLEFLSAVADQVGAVIGCGRAPARVRQQIRDEERGRLAVELHDSAVQQLFSLRLQVQALRLLLDRGGPVRPERVGRLVGELDELVGVALEEVREVMLGLRPVELPRSGLTAALRTHCESVCERNRLGLDFRGKLPDEDLLDPELAGDIARFVQEALRNVVRHAGATRVQVRIGREDRLLAVHVRDDGGGIDPAGPPPDRLGMVSMRQRAERWGGWFGTDSAPGRGCTVSFHVPVPFQGAPSFQGARDAAMLEDAS